MKTRVLKTQPKYVTRGFGNGHGGVDLGWDTTPTDTIISHSDGVVVFCQTGYGNEQGSSGNASYGNCVKIRHPNGYFTLYAHLSKVLVKSGQSVKTGQPIGNMGNTGNSYGNHLHWEVRNANDERINPEPYINGDLPHLKTKKEDDSMLSYEQWKAYQERYEREQAAQKTSKWAEAAVEFCKKHGIMKGDSDGRFRPLSGVTRQEVAQVAKNLFDAISGK